MIFEKREISNQEFINIKSRLFPLRDENIKKFVRNRLKIKDLINELNNKNNSESFIKQIYLKLDLMSSKIKVLIYLKIYYDIIYALYLEVKIGKRKYITIILSKIY